MIVFGQFNDERKVMRRSSSADGDHSHYFASMRQARRDGNDWTDLAHFGLFETGKIADEYLTCARIKSDSQL